MSATGFSHTDFGAAIAFDTMGRPNQLTDGLGNTLVNGITYGPASELLYW
jgi:hypothetical protein